MTLCDTGPIVALINAKDSEHARCVAALSQLSKPLITTCSCMTEAMYLLWQFGGFPAQDELWDYLETGLILLHTNSPDERTRMRALIRRYRDVPMDFADASLVAAAEALDETRIFTLDSDFYVYCLLLLKTFDITP